MSEKIERTTNSVMDFFRRIDNFIYELGDKIL